MIMEDVLKKILLYGVAKDNLPKIIPVLEKSGARVHLLSNEQLHETLMDVLESEESLEFVDPQYPMSLCLFAAYTKEEIYQVIGELTELKIEKPVFATVTKKNIEWKVGRLLVDVNQEHIEMTQNMPKANRD